MSVVSKTRQYASGDILTAQFYNLDRDEIIAGVNSITDAQVAGSAAISLTKLASGTLPAPILITNDNISGTLDAANITNTAVTLTDVQSVSNKVLVKPTMAAMVHNLVTDTDGVTVTFDMALSNVHSVTLNGNRVLQVTNVSVGQPFMIRLTQGAVGSHTVTWFGTIKWTGGNVPSLTTTSGSTDVFGFICTSAGNYDGYYVSFDLR